MMATLIELLEHGAMVQAEGHCKCRRRQFLRFLAFRLEHFDLAALARDPQTLGPQLDDLAHLASDGAEAAAQMRAGSEDLDLLPIQRGPGARRRVAAANQVVREIDVTGPVDPGLGAAAPAFVRSL